MEGTDEELRSVVAAFWASREASEAASGHGEQARSGGHMTALQSYVRKMFIDAGLQPDDVVVKSTALPGYFRRSKQWDVIAMYKGVLVGVVELKSQKGSVSNNANNRIEEAIGSAIDLQTLQSKTHKFGTLPIWQAYVLVLGLTDLKEERIKKRTTMFPIEPAFKDVTYSEQYCRAMERYVQEKVYDAAWFLITKNIDGKYSFAEPIPTATSVTLASLIRGRIDYVKKSVDGGGAGVGSGG